MIRIQLDWAIAIYITWALLLVLLLWIFYNCLEDKNLAESTDDMMQCEFCGHVFFNHQGAEIVVCPLCRSYVTASGRGKKPQKQSRRRDNAESESG